MIRPPRRATLLAWLMALAGPTAAAQSTLPGNSLGVFLDPAGLGHQGAVPAGQPFSFYVVTNRPFQYLYAFELAVQVDPRLRVLSRAADPQSDDILEGDDQWAVSFRSRCIQSSEPYVLLTYQVVADAPASDLGICVVGSTPSSVEPPVPAHLGCTDLSQPIAFVPAYPGCAQVEATAVPALHHAWGVLKARYAGGEPADR